MENTVNSLKEAIDITLYKLNYDKDNTDIIKKLILDALYKDSSHFTRTNNAREYVSNLSKKEILQELIDNSKPSNDIDEVIDRYIKRNYTTSNEFRELIHEKSDLDKVSKKIRYFNIISDNDKEFYDNVWNYFSKIFVGEQNEN